MSAAYDPLNPKGPNPMLTNVNSQFTDPTNDIWIQVASGCVWPIMPGIALLYAGLSRRQSAVSLLFLIFMIWGAVSIIWFLFGYSLVASVTGGPMIGNFVNGGLKNVIASPSPGAADINEPVYMIFECFFCVATVCIMVGGASERARIGPCLIFCCIWSVLVYDFVAYWTWSVNGWLYKLGTLDFAGGSPVHIASGFGALGYALVLGKRRDPTTGLKKTVIKSRPHDPVMVFIGTSLICFGWFFFNSGTALNDTVRSSYAFCNTNIAATSAIVTYSLMHYVRKKRWSVIAACEGAISGLVGITPAAGFVPFHFALVTGIITAAVCNLTEGIASKIGIDESLEAFSLHGLGGISGGICTALFAADWVARLDGVTAIDGGWINGHWVQLGYNLAGCVSIAAWSFAITVILLLIMDRIPWLSLRISEEKELEGFDSAVMEEQITWDLMPLQVEGITRALTSSEEGTEKY